MIVNLQRFIAEHHAQIEKSGLLRTIIKLLADVRDEDDVDIVNKNVEQQLYLFALEACILRKVS